MSGKEQVDRYIANYPDDVQVRLNEIRSIIRQAAPGAEEFISYRMPAYRQNGILVYFAGYTGHIGFYPTASGIEHFKHLLGEYRFSKGAIQFPLNRPSPPDLVKMIVAFRLDENMIKNRIRGYGGKNRKQK